MSYSEGSAMHESLVAARAYIRQLQQAHAALREQRDAALKMVQHLRSLNAQLQIRLALSGSCDEDDDAAACAELARQVCELKLELARAKRNGSDAPPLERPATPPLTLE